MNVTPIGGDNASQYVEKYEPLRRNGYRADFSRDTRMDPSVYHVIVSADGRPEILHWSQFDSLDEARKYAHRCIDDLSGDRREVAEAGT